MALIKCPECGSPLSTDADVCPQRAYKKPYPLGWHLRAIALTVIGIFVLIFVLAIVGAMMR